MSWLILASIAIGIFVIYNVVTLSLFGLPCSLSKTYYLLNEKWAGTGIWFSIMIISVFLLLMAPWVHVTSLVSSWSMYFSVLPFICCSGLIFVGIVPNIKTNKRIERIHTISALVAAVCALLWVFIVCWQISYIVPIWILICGGIAHLTKTAKSSRDWWLEMCAFVPTFVSIITKLILHL